MRKTAESNRDELFLKIFFKIYKKSTSVPKPSSMQHFVIFLREK